MVNHYGQVTHPGAFAGAARHARGSLATNGC